LLELEELGCLQNLSVDGKAPMYEYFQLKREEEELAKKVQKFALNSSFSTQFVSPGRVVVINNEVCTFGCLSFSNQSDTLFF